MAEAAALLGASLKERGLRFLLGAQTVAILGEERVRGVRFKDGLEIPADLVVMAVGIRPNVSLAKAAGIHCERGIVVNDTLQTYDPRIYAVGECVQHRGQTYGLVAPLWEQARVCANHLAHFGISRYQGSVTSTKLKVTGIDVFSAGEFGGGPGCDEIVLRDQARGVYKKLVVKDNRVKGAVLYGDTIDGSWYFQLLRESTDIGAFRESILFGQAHLGNAGHGGGNNVLAMPDEAEICGCNGVRKGAIVKAITAQKLFYAGGSPRPYQGVGFVRFRHWAGRATAGGHRRRLFRDLRGKAAVRLHRAHLNDQVRKVIREQHLTRLRAVFDFTTSGRRRRLSRFLAAPTINLFDRDLPRRVAGRCAIAVYQRARSRQHPERTGPTRWCRACGAAGPVPQELRAIADVADKFQIPTVKVTGGQRIDLLGVKKEDLPKVWADLNAAGMVFGHAYGKSWCTVKILRRYLRMRAGSGTQELDRPGGQAGKNDLGLVDAAQVQDGGVRLSAQLRRSHHQGFPPPPLLLRWCAWIPAMNCTSASNGGIKLRGTDL